MEESLVKTDTVGNLLFYGSDDHLLAIASTLRPYIKTLPDMDKFGWFYKVLTVLYIYIQ
jgi:ssDNA-specific exonuclease RecJ